MFILEGRIHPGVTEEFTSLKSQVSTLEKQLEGRHEKDSEKMETIPVDKEKIDQSKVRSVVVLDRELEESSFLTETEKDRQYDTDEKDRKEKELVNEENSVLKTELKKTHTCLFQFGLQHRVLRLFPPEDIGGQTDRRMARTSTHGRWTDRWK